MPYLHLPHYLGRMACVVFFVFFITDLTEGKKRIASFSPARNVPSDSLAVPRNLSTFRSDKDTVTVYGKIRDLNQFPLAGVQVVEQGTLNGTLSDSYGEFALTVGRQALLECTLQGFISAVVPIRNQLFMTVTLYEESTLLDSVIVTALGVQRNEVSLSYSASKVDGQEVSRNKDPNMITSLAGKVAGVQVHRNASGLGGSAQVLIRGIRTAASGNQPLYVIDGVPLLNTSHEQAFSAIGGTADAGNRDGGDGISDLNPDDVESITVLKGAPAAALYGSQAANGVILITTKKARQEESKITFSSSLTVDRAFSLPQFQNSYGVSDAIESWGERSSLPAYDNAGEFFNTGLTSITSFSLSNGTKQVQNYFSYAYTNVQGIVGESRQARHNVTYRTTTAFFHNRLSLDGNVNFIRQETKDRPVSGGFYMNPLVGLYRFPRGEDLGVYQNAYEVYDPARRLNTQHWHSDTQDFEQNPYWVIHRIHSKDVRSRVIASLAAKIQVTPDFKLQGRVGVDYSHNKVRQQYYATTAPALAGANGRYAEADYDETQFYADLLGLYEKRWGDFSLHTTLGASYTKKNLNSSRYDSKTASLHYANVFTLANINMNSQAYISQRIDAEREMQSLFATAQLGYQEALFLDVTARNDWSSTLAYTRHEHKGYFYPSLGWAWLMNRSLSLPKWISLAKFRTAFSWVGSDIPLYITHPMAELGAGGEIQTPEAVINEPLKPEMTDAWEVGTEWRFFLDRLGFNWTYYRTNTRNQFFQLPSRTGADAAYEYVNAGHIRNSGVEFQFDAIPVRTAHIRWKTGVNVAANRNKVVELHDQLTEFIYGPRGFSSSYAMKLQKGGSVGDIYGKAFRRDEHGVILFETEGDRAGMPLIDGDGNTVKVGNAMARCNLGWQNDLRIGLFEFGFLIDCRVGGARALPDSGGSGPVWGHPCHS